MSKQTLVKGAATLGIAGLAVKFLGAAFRLPVANLIGDTGMANYGPAYYIYSFFLILATAGIPVAISRMVSESRAIENHYQAHNVFKVATGLMALIGFISFLVLFIFAPLISDAVGNPDATLPMRAIAPSLIIVPVMAAFRGYFQGMQNMKPTAVSQVIEQLFRVVIGLSATYFLFNLSGSGFFQDNFNKYERGAAGANFGATAGSIGGILIVLIVYKLSRAAIYKRIAKSEYMGTEQRNEILSKVLLIAIPITIGAAIMPIINLVDTGLVINRLQDGAGFSKDIAKSMYGQLSGLVGPLINFPQVLTQAVAMSLVPIVAASYKIGDEEKLHDNVALGLRIASIIGLPCATGLFVLSKPILMLLYPAQLDSAISAGPVLAVMAIGVIFLATVQTLSGVLQGIDRQLVPVKNLLIGVLVKIILTYILTGIPSINVKGAAIGTVAAYAVAAVLNIHAVQKYTGTKIDIVLTFIKPLISSIIMAVSAFAVHRIVFLLLGSNSIATLSAVIIAAFIYAIMVFVTASVTIDELDAFPKGDKIKSLVLKFQNMKRWGR